MFRFSCFPAPIHYNKSKKSVQRSAETMQKNSQDFSQQQAPKISRSSSSSHPLESKSKVYESEPSSKSTEKATSRSSFEMPVPATIQTCPDVELDQGCCWKSEETSLEANTKILRTISLKKSQSVGSGLDRERRISCNVIDTEDVIDQGLPCDYIHEMNFNRTLDSFGHNGFTESFDYKDPESNVLNPSGYLVGLPYEQNIVVESFQMNADLIHVASIGDLEQLEREVCEDFGLQLSAEHVSNGGQCTPGTSPIIAKSYSLPDLGACAASPGKDSMVPVGLVPHSRSSEDLYMLDVKRGKYSKKEDELCFGNTLDKSECRSPSHNISEAFYSPGKEISGLSPTRLQIPCQGGTSGEDSGLSNQSGGSYEIDQERDRIIERDELEYKNLFTGGHDSCDMTDFVKNWTVAEKADGNNGEQLQGEVSVHRLDELPCKEFHIKRIEEWISKIDIQNSSRLFEELGECSSSVHKTRKDSNALGVATAAKIDAKFSHGMEFANSYLSSLTAMSTSAQLANLGLVLVPHLSVFSGLRVINLSGNGIVHITAGALPRGLHMLNLSRNNISTIEGLRELTRLRVLDLSYNRIFRIGHGLASCSSLKALYLAGNKISEVEGLHRLLKLNILDLSFNKISTAKCLGQLAANYGSLQFINLEGNPAQKNVGDEQLKKSLLSLLPNLIYLNKQPIKASSSKEVSSRSITMRQFDRGLRSEHKASRKGSHSSSTHKAGSSSSHGVGLPKGTKSRHGRLPPNRAKGTHQQLIIDNKLLTARMSNSMRRSRSEGTL